MKLENQLVKMKIANKVTDNKNQLNHNIRQA